MKSYIIMCVATVIFVLVLTMCPANGADISLVFDGVTDGGWTISNQPADPPIPFANVEVTGFPGIAFNDTVQGVAYYMAPASITSLDLTGETLAFNFWIDNDAVDLVDDDTFADIVINGTPIALDVIDEGQLDVLQNIVVDFTNPAFAGVDLSNITSLGIRSEYWSSGGESIESYLVSVPEPAMCVLAGLGFIGAVLYFRKMS